MKWKNKILKGKGAQKKDVGFRGEIIFVVLVYLNEHCEDISNLFPMTLKDFKVS